MKTLLFALFLAQASTQTSNGVVTGRILAIDGSPAVGIRVAAVPVADGNSPTTTAILSNITQTDAQGNYRLVNIAPGPYYIMAGLLDRPTYYPGVTSPGSNSVVPVAETGTAAGIDFKLTRALGFKLSGRITGVTNLPPAPGIPLARVSLLPRTPQTAALNADVRPDLSFEFANVPPGTYEIHLSGLGTYMPWPNVFPLITVSDRNVSDIVLAVVDSVTSGVAVSGRVKGLPQDIFPDLRIVLMLANPPNGHLKILNTIIRADGSFEFTGITTGRYALRVVRSRTAETIDVPYAPVVSTFEVIDKDVRGLELEIAPEVVR